MWVLTNRSKLERFFDFAAINIVLPQKHVADLVPEELLKILRNVERGAKLNHSSYEEKCPKTLLPEPAFYDPAKAKKDATTKSQFLSLVHLRAV
jgi:hypothetical protein